MRIDIRFKFNVFLLFILFSSSCSNENNSALKLDYIDTSEYLLDTHEEDSVNIFLNNKLFSVISEKVFPDTSILKPVFRIPSIILTNSGTKLVTVENRSSIYDYSKEIEILVSRKSLNDTCWTIRKLWSYSPLYGRSMNPMFVIDRSGKFGHINRIYIFAFHVNCVGYDVNANTDEVDMVYKYSDDDGITWSGEFSLKHIWDVSKYAAAVPSCANGIQLDDGTLIIPTMTMNNGHFRSGLAYCYPYGNWHISSPTPNIDDNESTVYQDNEGNIVLDCRTEERIRRKYIYDMHGDSWTPLPGSFNNTLNLKAEITKCVLDGNLVYLLTYCDTPDETRQNITLWGSLDGIKWAKICRLQEGNCHFAYSNISVYNDKIVVVYETRYNGTRVLDLSDLRKDIIEVLLNNIECQ